MRLKMKAQGSGIFDANMNVSEMTEEEKREGKAEEDQPGCYFGIFGWSVLLMKKLFICSLFFLLQFSNLEMINI